jgi:hypothetical protein
LNSLKLVSIFALFLLLLPLLPGLTPLLNHLLERDPCEDVPIW